MPFTVLQHVQAPTTGTVSLAATTAGSLIVVAVSNDGITGDPTAVTLTGSSDVFTKDVSAANTNPTANVNLSVWSDPNCSAGKTQVVVSGNLGSGVLTDVWEIAGAATSSPLQDKHGAAGPASTLQAAFDSGAMGSIPAGCFGVASVIGIGSGGRAQASVTGSGTWTTESALQPGSVSQLLSARQNTLAAGTPNYAGTFTAPVAGAYWAAVVAAYKPATTVLSGAAAFTAPATLTAAATVTRRGAASLSASPVLSAAAVVSRKGIAALAASPSLAAAPLVTARGTASLLAPGSLAAAAIATRVASAHLSAGPSLLAPAVITKRAAASLAAPASLAAAAIIVRHGTAHLSAPGSLSAASITAGTVHLAAPGALSASPRVTVRAGAALEATALASVATEDPAVAATEALWTAYLAAYQAASGKWANWRMMRQAGGTDGTAGFLFGEAYEAQAVADQAYEAWRLAQQQAYPGRRG